MNSNEKSILILGDTCLDIFVYCNCERLCPEAPVPVLDTIETVENLGMAGNVFRNVKCLYDNVILLTNDNYKKVTKTRYVENKTNHMFIRIDSNEKIERIPDFNLKAINFEKYEAVIISDYNKGFLTENDIAYIGKQSKLTFLDTKKILGPWVNDITFIKINRGEYFHSIHTIKQYNLDDKIIQTLGAGGCKYKGIVYPVKEVEVKDLSGAGDSFLAALVVKYIENFDISDALVAANEAASIVVQKKGVSIIKE